HIIEATPSHRGGKSRQIANHSTAESDDQITALDPRRDQGLADVFERLPALRAFARWHHDMSDPDTGRRQRSIGYLEVVDRYGPVNHDRSPGVGPYRRDPLAEGRELSAADHNIVTARPERHTDDNRIARAQRHGHGARPSCAVCGMLACAMPRRRASSITISSTMRSCGTSRDCTVMSARSYVG